MLRRPGPVVVVLGEHIQRGRTPRPVDGCHIQEGREDAVPCTKSKHSRTRMRSAGTRVASCNNTPLNTGNITPPPTTAHTG